MKYPDSFKKGFIDKIESELNKCEIIYNPKTNGIWFINREKKYWYLEYKVNDNFLWWRYDFFNSYIQLFGMDDMTFDEIISKWVEDVLNYKVDVTESIGINDHKQVEDTLNCRVDATRPQEGKLGLSVEDTLNQSQL